MRDEYVARIGAGTVDAEEARARHAVVVQLRLADRALAAADPGINDALLPDLDAFCFRAEGLDDAEWLVAERERRYAAALLHVEALAAAPVEVAVPDVQVGVADARARDAHQHFRSFRLGRFLHDLLQRLAVFQ